MDMVVGGADATWLAGNVLVVNHTLIFSGGHLGLACTCTLYVLSCEHLSTWGWWSSHKKCGYHLWDDAYVL